MEVQCFCNCISGNCLSESVKIALSSIIYTKIKVLQLILVILMKSLLVSYSSPNEHRTLLLKHSHMSTLHNPKYLIDSNVLAKSLLLPLA